MTRVEDDVGEGEWTEEDDEGAGSDVVEADGRGEDAATETGDRAGARTARCRGR